MTDLNIKDVAIEPIENAEGLIGFTNFCVNDDLKICNVAIYTCLSSSTGIRLVFPQKRCKGEYLNMVYPINNVAYEVMVVAVANAYYELMDKLKYRCSR